MFLNGTSPLPGQRGAAHSDDVLMTERNDAPTDFFQENDVARQQGVGSPCTECVAEAVARREKEEAKRKAAAEAEAAAAAAAATRAAAAAAAAAAATTTTTTTTTTASADAGGGT